MSSAFSIPTLDAVFLNRLLRKDSVDKAVTWFRIGLLVLCVLLLFYILYAAGSAVLSVHTNVDKASNVLNTRLQQDAELSTGDEKNRDFAFLKKKSPFGDIGAKTPTLPTKEPEKKITQMQLALIGTFITPGSTPYAIIEDSKKKSQEVFNIKDKVFDEATLVGIFSDRVELRRNGQIEILKLDDSLASSDDSSSAASDSVTVAEDELNAALDNLPLLLTQARAVPYFKDGKAIGLRLFAIKTGSMYEKIGLKNGDILKSINGNSLGDITQAVKLFEKLREERAIALVLVRNREERTIRYEIR